MNVNALKDRIRNIAKERGQTAKECWTGHLKKLGPIAEDLSLPNDMIEVIREINCYLIRVKLITLGTIVADMMGKSLFEQVETALASGASVDDESRNQHRPLHMAIKKERKDVATLLIEFGADIHHRDLSGNTPLEIAINAQQFEVAKLLIENGASLTPYTNHKYNHTKLCEFQQFLQKGF